MYDKTANQLTKCPYYLRSQKFSHKLLYLRESQEACNDRNLKMHLKRKRKRKSFREIIASNITIIAT